MPSYRKIFKEDVIMGIIKETKLTRIERNEVYIVMRINLSMIDFLKEEPVRAFTTIEKAREYLRVLRNSYADCLVDEEFYGGVFEDDYGIEKWAYYICILPLDTTFNEVVYIGCAPAFTNDK